MNRINQMIAQIRAARAARERQQIDELNAYLLQLHAEADAAIAAVDQLLKGAR